MKAKKILFILILTIAMLVPLTSVKAETCKYNVVIKSATDKGKTSTSATSFLNKIQSMELDSSGTNLVIKYKSGYVFDKAASKSALFDKKTSLGEEDILEESLMAIKNTPKVTAYTGASYPSKKHTISFDKSKAGGYDYSNAEYFKQNCGKDIIIQLKDFNKKETDIKYSIYFAKPYNDIGNMNLTTVCTINNISINQEYIDDLKNDSFLKSITSAAIVKDNNSKKQYVKFNTNQSYYDGYDLRTADNAFYIEYNGSEMTSAGMYRTDDTDAYNSLTMRLVYSPDKYDHNVLISKNPCDGSITLESIQQSDGRYRAMIFSGDNVAEQRMDYLQEVEGWSEEKAVQDANSIIEQMNEEFGTSYSIYTLTDIEFCSENGVQKVFYVLGVVLMVVKILIPLLLIIFGSIDFFKAVVSNDDKSMNVAIEAFIKRLIAGVIIFFVPTVVYYTTSLIGNSVSKDEPDYIKCTTCLLKPGSCPARGINNGNGSGGGSNNPDSTSPEQQAENLCAYSIYDCTNHENCKVYNNQCVRKCGVLNAEQCGKRSDCEFRGVCISK